MDCPKTCFFQGISIPVSECLVRSEKKLLQGCSERHFLSKGPGSAGAGGSYPSNFGRI